MKDILIRLLGRKKTVDSTVTIPPTIKSLTAKDYLHLEHWALINNLHVHPEYIKAVKKKEKLLVTATIIGVILAIIIMKTIVLIISELIK